MREGVREGVCVSDERDHDGMKVARVCEFEYGYQTKRFRQSLLQKYQTVTSAPREHKVLVVSTILSSSSIFGSPSSGAGLAFLEPLGMESLN